MTRRRWAGVLALLLLVGALAGPAPGRRRPVKCFGHRVNLSGGTATSDLLIGRTGKDVAHGRAGNDSIFGLSGNDRLCGGRGDDRLNGGGGFDRIDGGAGYDVCSQGERVRRCEDVGAVPGRYDQGPNPPLLGPGGLRWAHAQTRIEARRVPRRPAPRGPTWGPLRGTPG